MEKIIIGAMEYLGGRFLKYLDDQTQLIEDAKNQVGELRDDFTFLTKHLKQAVRKPISNNLITTSLMREVRDSIYKAEDAIDSFVADKESNWIPTFSKSDIAELIISAAGKVKEVRKKVEEHINNSNGQSAEDEVLREYKGEPPIQEYAPIFIKEENTLRQRLTREAEKADVIFITGMHGIGKTTLAAKMFHDLDIRQHFTKHIWVTVPNPTAERIFRVILKQLDKVPNSNNKWELSKQVASYLHEERFFLVLDSVPKIDESEMLRSAFGKKGKVLITSNNDALAGSIVRHEDPIKLNPLDSNDSWTLLHSQVPMCPPDLFDTGILIATNCEGLPQRIVEAGNALARVDNRSYDMKQRKQIWQQVSIGIITFSKDESNEEQNASILSSYNELPYNLRDCFLYLGIFPKNSKFPISKLIRMWIAEGFVQPDDLRATGDLRVTLEETAQRYLSYLVNRNLVKIEEAGRNSLAKTCSMNELLYDFCKKEAGPEEENFLQEFKSVSGGFHPTIEKANLNRRVCVHDHISDFMGRFISSSRQDTYVQDHISKFIPGVISSSRQDRFQIHLRSFVSHSKGVFDLNKNDIPKIRAAFKLLRLLDAKPIKVDRIHSDLCMLVHLRYVTLSLSGDVLPQAISKLRNVQTLIVGTTSPILEIEGNILKMVELRHFETNASATLNFPNKSKASEENKCLQTLCGVSPKSCTGEFFSKLPNLKKLGICGQLAILLLDDKSELLRNLVNVENLKLLNQETEGDKLMKLLNWGRNPKDEGKLNNGLLQPSRFPLSLRCLTLSATCLDWEHISILGKVENLEVLKLKNNAFVGEKWEVADEGFPYLETLHIKRTDFHHWKASSNHFPRLRRLLLSKCVELMEIPIELANIQTFQKLHLHNCGYTVDSGKKIEGKKKEERQIDGKIEFKLCISKVSCKRL